MRIQINDRKFAKLLSPEMTSFGRDGAYSLTVSEKGIDIKALAPEGAFYALQSLRQMTAEGTELSCCNILDWPRLRYRGMMLDISRNFRDKDFIIKQLDAMALLRRLRGVSVVLGSNGGISVAIMQKRAALLPRVVILQRMMCAKSWHMLLSVT